MPDISNAITAIQKSIDINFQSGQPSRESKALSNKEKELFSKQELENKDMHNDIKLRWFYAKGFFYLIVFSSFVVYSLIILIGLDILKFEPSVTLELIPLVFLNLISVILIIVRYLFKKK